MLPTKKKQQSQKLDEIGRYIKCKWQLNLPTYIGTFGLFHLHTLQKNNIPHPIHVLLKIHFPFPKVGYDMWSFPRGYFRQLVQDFVHQRHLDLPRTLEVLSDWLSIDDLRESFRVCRHKKKAHLSCVCRYMYVRNYIICMYKHIYIYIYMCMRGYDECRMAHPPLLTLMHRNKWRLLHNVGGLQRCSWL